MRDCFCEHEVYCSPPCNTTVTSVWSPAFTRCYPKVPEIGMPHENCLLYSCVLLSVSSKRHSAVRGECFFCAFLWCHVSAVLRSYQPAKVTDVKEQRICSNSTSNSARRLQKHRMLKEAFDDNDLDQTQTCKWFKHFKNRRMSVDDGAFWTTFDQNHDRKCGKIARGYPGRPTTNDSWCLQHCQTVVWNVPVNFVGWAQHAAHCNKIWPKDDNTPVHVSLVVQQFLASMNMTVIPHPPFSPELAPCDFFLFPKMKL